MLITFASWFDIAPASAACEYGYGLCGDGTCAPLGSVCCGGGRHCPSGNICTNDNRCLPTTSPSYCGGTSYCKTGFVCTKEGKCLSMDSPSYCGGRTYCDPGFACIGGKKCLSMQSARYCGSGKYCDEGFECTADAKCRPAGSAVVPAMPSGTQDDGSGQVDASQCVDVTGNGSTIYTVKNTCTFAVTIVLETMDFSPRKASQDRYSLSAGGDLAAISYHGVRPVVTKACGKGQSGCG